ncbi:MULTISPECIES: glucose PTS transporter subunit IIA [unclassified Corynebacterium]|uniref:glucose PTS transporter subunit IIA n=1 Tax=unclassified Corynebacterium TaxID=2624378 RepID=UPI0029CA7F8D|nr:MULTISPECIES: glucose PTS transporter subunit IIA [unclassified Corynebacterium]WPF67093.1 glucose PTS transporter subunit IIA [Corynebacterium sp. 22KM0430]WPF69581.1 glucose PTS transporter subunit IIA [Corynebacterium sp. 21KM1197]
MSSNTATTSQRIITEIGGAANVSSLTHCATRLRFQLHDQSRVNVAALEKDPAVLGVVKQGSTGLQVIMGGGVADYYAEIMRDPAMATLGDSEGKKPAAKEYGGVRGKYSWIDYSFEFLSDTFRPVLWALLGASLIITMLVLADNALGWQDFRAPMSEQPPTYQFLHAMWRSVFYFLPIMVGATAARKLGANEWVGAAIPAALFTPEFMGLKDVAREIPTAVEGAVQYQVDVFGLPMTIQDYGGQVFPPLLAAIALFFVEKGLKKIIPAAVQMVFVPFISLLVLIPATAFIMGPVGIGLGNAIAQGLFWLNDLSSFILAVVIPLLYPFLVPLGLHWPLNAIMIVNINTLGYDFIQGPMGAWNFACFGVITGVLILSIKERNKPMRQVSAGGMFAGLLGGISEPSLYGVLLRFRKSYWRLLPGCLVGGIIVGIFNVKAYAFVFTSLLTISAMDPMPGYALGIGAAFITSLLLTLALDYRTKQEREDMRAQIAAELDAANAAEEERIAAVTPQAQGASISVAAPLAGRVLPLGDVPDAAFAAGAVGQGVAIDPTGDTVVAPADAKVMAAFPTGHAIGLKLDGGAQVLIHIGVDTVNMEGKGFELLVAKGDRVSAGQPLVRFDRAAIEAAGYSPITPVLVTNHKKFGAVEARQSGGDVQPGAELLVVMPKEAETAGTV